MKHNQLQITNYKLQIRDGFTLIELLVATAILGIVMVMASGVFASIVKNARQAEAIGKMKIVASEPQEFFLRQVRAAASFDTPSGDQVIITGADGKKYTITCTNGTAGPPPTHGSITYKVEGGSAVNMVLGYDVSNCDISSQSVVYTFSFDLSQAFDAPDKQEFKGSLTFKSSAVPGFNRK